MGKGKAYSEEIRERALKYFEAHSWKETKEVFGVSRQAVYDWIDLQKETGKLQERQRSGRKSKMDELPEFEKVIIMHHDKSSREIAEILGFSISRRTVLNWLHRLGYTFKKNVLPPEKGRKSTRIFSKS
jgi:transposase